MTKKIILLSISILIGPFANACLELPKRIKLDNSPFPFSSFSLESSRFIYGTPDGKENQIICSKSDKRYEWTALVIQNRRFEKYGYDDLLGAGKILVDENEKKPQTTLKIGDTESLGYAVISKEGQMTSIQLTCTIDKDGIQTMQARLINKEGHNIAEISAAKLTGTRSIDGNEIADAVVDFNQPQSQNISFAGCGAKTKPNNKNNTDVVR